MGMIEKYVSQGDKVEMKSTVRVVLPDGTEGVKTYKTYIYDILDDGHIEIAMPMEKTKLVLLPIGGEYDVCFMGSNGMYSANVRIVDRQKKVNGTYIIVTEMISNFRKLQRREYFRFNCIIDMHVRKMSDEEIDSFAKGNTLIIPENNMIKGVIVDISGGGIRFVSDNKFDEGSIIMLEFELPIMDISKSFLVAAEVIYSYEIKNRKGGYETRAKFKYMNSATREEIIKYIFDEDRKNRKNGKGR